MMDENFCYSELRAWSLLHRFDSFTTETKMTDYHNAANEIILLAEKIKAERAVAAMNHPNVKVSHK